MASADGVGEESFLSHAERLRSEIHTKFIGAHEILKEREAELIAELERLVDEYIGDKINHQIKQLSISQDALRDTLTENENKEILDQNLASIDARIKVLRTKLQTTKDAYKSVSLEWNVDLEKKLSVAGAIRLNTVKEGIRDYKQIGDPIAVFGKHSKEGCSPGVFCYPKGIAINPENNSIYICDGGNARVQVYNKYFEFLFQFSDQMNGPVGICIKQNKVYVTQYTSNCINVYSIEGQILNSVGVKGKKELMFDGPRGLDVSSDRDRIYIAEYINGRIQCLNLNLEFNSYIDGINGAKDVNLASNEVVVLSSRNPCISLYTYSHQLIREMILKGNGNPINSPSLFILDKSLNILITDFESNFVLIFSLGGELIHRFGREGEKKGAFIEPTGIAIDVEGRIIVVSYNTGYCVQVF